MIIKTSEELVRLVNEQGEIILQDTEDDTFIYITLVVDTDKGPQVIDGIVTLPLNDDEYFELKPLEDYY